MKMQYSPSRCFVGRDWMWVRLIPRRAELFEDAPQLTGAIGAQVDHQGRLVRSLSEAQTAGQARRIGSDSPS